MDSGGRWAAAGGPSQRSLSENRGQEGGKAWTLMFLWDNKRTYMSKLERLIRLPEFKLLSLDFLEVSAHVWLSVCSLDLNKITRWNKGLYNMLLKHKKTTLTSKGNVCAEEQTARRCCCFWKPLCRIWTTTETRRSHIQWTSGVICLPSSCFFFLSQNYSSPLFLVFFSSLSYFPVSPRSFFQNFTVFLPRSLVCVLYLWL